MNENANTVATREPEEIELDLRDMLATLFLRWKTLLLCLLAGALVFGLYAFRSAPRTTTVSFVTEEQVFAAKQSLTEDRTAAVERLYDLVRFYTDYLARLEEEYSSMYGDGGNLENAVSLQETWYVSSEIDNIGSYLASSLMDESDYDRLREITVEEGAVRGIYKLVDFSTYSGLSAWDGEVPYDPDTRQYLFSVTAYGMSEVQAVEILAVADEALQRKAVELRKVDSSLKLTAVGRRVNYDAVGELQFPQDQLWNNYNKANNSLNTLKNQVNTLTGDEKNYYNKLESYRSGGSIVTSGGRSLKKWTAIGAVLGLFGGVVLVFWPYLFDGKVKTAGELEYSLRSMVLSRVSVKGKRNLFGPWAARLTGADGVDPGVKADMVAADLGVLMEKGGKMTVYLLCDAGDANAAALAEQVKARLLEKLPSADITVGNPLSAADQLEKIGSAELGVVFAEVKKTKRAVLRQWMQVCARYRLPVAGSVSVQKCW